MEFRKIGLYLGIFGTLLLFVAMIMGAIIGYNDKIIEKVDNSAITEFHFNGSVTTKYDELENMEDAEKSNAFLLPFNIGLSSFGIGIILIGIGFSIAQNSKDNLSFLVVAVIGIILLSTSLILSVIEGLIYREEVEIHYKNDKTEKDDERQDKNEENRAFLSPFNQFLGGFIYGSLGIALALLSIILSLFHTKKIKKDPEEEKTIRISVEPLTEDEVLQLE